MSIMFAKARFIRRISAVSNAIETIDNEMICFIIYCLNCIRHGRNATFERGLKDVRAHCYCASLVRTQFIGHARATSFSSARTESKTRQNIELMTFALTWCANISVGCSVIPTFFSADHFLF